MTFVLWEGEDILDFNQNAMITHTLRNTILVVLWKMAYKMRKTTQAACILGKLIRFNEHCDLDFSIVSTPRALSHLIFTSNFRLPPNSRDNYERDYSPLHLVKNSGTAK